MDNKKRCPYCVRDILNKDFAKHLNKIHLDEIFNNKNNIDELEGISGSSGKHFRPLELKTKTTVNYYTPCCKKYYSRLGEALKHSADPDCQSKVVQEAKDLLTKIRTPAPIIVSTNNDISGNNNTINNIYNFYDLSGNLIKSICKELVDLTEHESYNKVYYLKKLNKLRKIFKDDPLYDSEISSIDSAYDSDDESETKLSRVDLNKQFKYVPEISKKLSEAKLDVSRRSIGVRTKEQSLEQRNAKQKEIDDFNSSVEEFEYQEKINNLRSGIKSQCDKIKRLEKREKELQEANSHPDFAVSQEEFDREYSQAKSIKIANKELADMRSELSRIKK